MYCCLAELRCSEKNLLDHDMDRLTEAIKLQLDPGDKFAAIHRRMLLFTSLETYAEAREKFSSIQERFAREHGPYIKLMCGFAEVRDDDIFSAIGEAKQMLGRTTDRNPLLGMRHYKFSEI